MKKTIFAAIIFLPFFLSVGLAQNPKRLLIDDLTASFCGHCPCMDTMLHNVIQKQYPGTIILAFHGQSSAYHRQKMDEIVNHLGPWGSPAAIPDRRCASQYILEFRDSVDAIYSRIPQASVKIEILNKTWDFPNRELKFNVRATAVDTGLTGLFRINVALIEQNLIGLQWFMPECGPKPEDTMYNHLNVVRDMLYPWNGDSLIGPAWPQLTTIERQVTMNLDEDVVPGNCEFVVYVDKKGPKPDSLYLCQIQQAEKQTVTGSLGIEPDQNASASVLSVYPNPAIGTVNVHLWLKGDPQTRIELYDAAGKQVRQNIEHIMKPGVYNFEFKTKGMKPGIYSVVVHNSGTKVSKKIIVQQ